MKGAVDVNMAEETKIEFKAEKPLELQTTEQICKMLGRTIYPEWDEGTTSLTMVENGETLKGKEVYDLLFGEAGEYIREQTLSGNSEKGIEMTELLKDAGRYASQYYAKQNNRISVREKLKRKQEELNAKSFEMPKVSRERRII